MAAMAGVDDNAPDFQPERARQRPLTAARRLCGGRGADVISQSFERFGGWIRGRCGFGQSRQGEQGRRSLRR